MRAKAVKTISGTLNWTQSKTKCFCTSFIFLLEHSSVVESNNCYKSRNLSNRFVTWASSICYYSMRISQMDSKILDSELALYMLVSCFRMVFQWLTFKELQIFQFFQARISIFYIACYWKYLFQTNMVINFTHRRSKYIVIFSILVIVAKGIIRGNQRFFRRRFNCKYR